MNQEKIPLILSVETITAAGNCAVWRGATLLAESRKAECLPVNLSENLLPMLKNVVAEAGISLREVDLVAVVNGPGSFTGLRLGLATAKALVMALDCRLAGIPTLECGAFHGAERGKNLILYPAGRGSFYHQEWEKTGSQLMAVSAVGCRPLEEIFEVFSSEPSQKLVFMTAQTSEITEVLTKKQMRLITNQGDDLSGKNGLVFGKFLNIAGQLAIIAGEMAWLKYRDAENSAKESKEVEIIYGREIRLGKS